MYSSPRTLWISNSFSRSRRRLAIIMPLLILMMLLVGSRPVDAFNLSPFPSLVIGEPRQETSLPKVRSSYFGYTLSLRDNHILIGSPRAQSSLASQSGINETGAIYRCPLNIHTRDVSCVPYVLESSGNADADTDGADQLTGENRTNQWLGASMDGGVRSSDPFVVCAPRMSTQMDVDEEVFDLMHGICYLTNGTTDERPSENRVFKKKALTLKPNQLVDQEQSNYLYGMAEQGISVHISDDGKNVLFGAPGIYEWKGSVVLFKEQSKVHPNAVRRRRRATPANGFKQYVASVPDPSTWAQANNSYFGYAVSSGYFGKEAKRKVLLVASAPHANLQQGEVYVFDVIKNRSGAQTIQIWGTLQGYQIGEYFGYAVVAEDFNGDGLSDLAVAAPFRSSRDDGYDQGAVYVFSNRNGLRLELQTTLESDYAGSGRFGTTLSRIGDLNGDGFMDLAVGAPFEERGAVYIFLGGPNGLNAKPSQRIAAPQSHVNQMMFGYGLSKGADFDGNAYLDLAVGAPNADTTFVYRAYPVAQVKAVITPTLLKIPINATTIQFKACWSISTRTPIAHDPDFQFTIKLDPDHKRVNFENTTELTRNVTIGNVEKCFPFSVATKSNYNLISNEIRIEMHHKMLHSGADSQTFCEHCVAVNPADAKMVSANIGYDTGCRHAKCVSDLRVTSSLASDFKFERGSTKTLSAVFAVSNRGEVSFSTHLMVTLVGTVRFKRIPNFCIESEQNVMECVLMTNGPLNRGGRSEQRIEIDLSQASGESFGITAHAKSGSNDPSNDNNTMDILVRIVDRSLVNALGKSTLLTATLEEGLSVKNVSHSFEIENMGPSDIDDAEVVVSIPTLVWLPNHLNQTALINMSTLTIEYTYGNLKKHPQLVNTSPYMVTGPPIEGQGDKYLRQHLTNGAYDPAFGVDQSESILNPEEAFSQMRRRRSIRSAFYFSNAQINAIVKNQSAYRPHFNEFDSFVESIPQKKTIYLDCSPSYSGCAQARFVVTNFRPNNLPIHVRLNFSIDLAAMKTILSDMTADILVLSSSASVFRVNATDLSTVAVHLKRPYTIISHVSVVQNWWYIVMSIILGILILVLISYAMYRYGFFERKLKDEMETLVRHSHQAAPLQQPSSDDE